MAEKHLARDVMDQFRKVVQLLRSSHRAAENLNVTGAQLFVMSILAQNDGAMSVGELAERTETDPSTVSVVAGRLVDRGILKRKRSAEDARRMELSLTPKGRALQSKAPVTVAQKRLADALHNLSARDVASLNRIMAALLTDMGADSTAPEMMFEDAPRARRRGAKRSAGPARRRAGR